MFKTFDKPKKSVKTKPDHRISRKDEPTRSMILQADKLVADKKALDPFADGEENQSSASDEIGLASSMDDFLSK